MIANDSTRFEFLTRDGAVAVCFRPRLPIEAYDEPKDLVEEAEDAAALKIGLVQLAGRYGVGVAID